MVTAPHMYGLTDKLDILPCSNPPSPTNLRLLLSQGRNHLSANTSMV